MANNIVTLNVSQTVAPAPSTLQRTGAFLSHGGTITAPGTMSLLTQLSDLTPLLALPAAITTLVWAAGIVTATTAQPHNLIIGDVVRVIIAGATPVAYNIPGIAATITGPNTFTYTLVTNPGTSTAPGTWLSSNTVDLVQMATTFFGQGAGVGVYVLELGTRSSTATVVALATWLTANPNTIYMFLLPRSFNGGTPGLLALVSQYAGITAKVKFFITTTLTDYLNFNNLMPDVFAMIEAPVMGAYTSNAFSALTWTAGIVSATTTSAHGLLPGQWFTAAGATPAGYNGTWLALPGTSAQTIFWALVANPGTQTTLGTLVGNPFSSPGILPGEFSAAAAFHVALNYAPSTTNMVTPFTFSYLVGVTPFPIKGNSALLSILKAASVNWVGTGAEGGISNTCLFWGTMMDGRDFTYWYSVDWVQLSVDIDVTNEVINGSNNPLAPLYYNQDGINRLQARAQGTMRRGVTYGLILPPVTVNAVPFAPYVLVNQSDYPLGIYNGLSVIFVPNRGFKAITFNVNVTDFPLA